ncbi:MAG TPA: hypothetical protein VN193_02890 [Candidatus Angelobacter sp.]|jgi:hypothetical protein|nr:hypothetical protein [Candidatus Angelobacter sp.]
MSGFIDDVRVLGDLLLQWAAPPPNRARRAHRRGEGGMEALQLAIIAAIGSVIAIAAGLVIKNAVSTTTSKVQTP